jgi:UDP-N-acetylmuramoyl-tripeptide--D-alanyl-D-alanine ligase
MALWTANDITQALNFFAIDSDFVATGVSIDTRTIKKGEIYVAIKGELLDGHIYVKEAFAKGASAAIVSTPLDLDLTKHTYFLVDDTLNALTQLGQYARSRSVAKIVAVTGSAGKTTIKEWLHQVLGLFEETAFSPASFNNHWGVPVSLASLDKNTQYGVFEIGTNSPGEIAPLAKMVNPDIAIITTITEAHIGRLGSLEMIASEKSEIFSGLKAGGTAIINYDIPQFEHLAKIARSKGAAHVYGFGKNAGADARLISYEVNPDRISSSVTAEIKGKELEYTLPFIGEHYALNSLVILTCVEALGLSVDKAAKTLSSLQPIKGRGLQHTLKLANGSTFTLIDDAYNANPTSMKTGLSVLGAAKTKGKKIAVLGEMLELGDKAAEYHKGLVPAIIAAEVNTVFATGKEMEHLFKTLPKNLQGKYEPTADALIPHVVSCIQDSDVVFVKGSKGSKVSKVVDYLLSQPYTAAA